MIKLNLSCFRMCETYKCVIMELILTAFGIICFIHDSDNNDSTEFNDIITLWDIEVNETILVK